MRATLSLVVLVWALGGCRSAAVRAPRPPVAPEPYVIDAEPLVRLKAQVVAPPEFPSPPPIRRWSIEELVTEPVKFRGTEQQLLDGGTGRVAVASENGKGTVAQVWSDALRLALSQAGVVIVDRDPAAGAAAPAGADYRIELQVVHDNRDQAQPQLLELPRRVTEEDWAVYQGELRTATTQLEQYRKAVDTYNATLAQMIDSAEQGSEATESVWEDYSRRYDRYTRRYRRYVDELDPEEDPSPLARKRTQRIVVKLPVEQGSAATTPVVAATEANVRREQSRLAVLLADNGVSPLAPASLERPVVKRPEELIEDDQIVKDLATVYRVSVAVRVVEAATGRMVWFGQAETQNLNHIDAVTGCCKAITDALVKPRQ